MTLEPASGEDRIVLAIVSKPGALASVEILTMALDLRGPEDFEPIVSAIAELDSARREQLLIALAVVASRSICAHDLQRLAALVAALSDADRVAL